MNWPQLMASAALNQERELVRRPLAVWCIGFSFGIFMEAHWSPLGWMWLVFFLSALLLFRFRPAALLKVFQKLAACTSLLILAAAFCTGSLLMQMEMRRPCPYDMGKETAVYGIVRQVQEEEQYCRITVSTGFRQKLLVNVRATPEQLGARSYGDLVGRSLTAVGTPELPSGQKNPGGFDYRLYLRTKDIFAVMDGVPGSVYAGDRVKNPLSNRLSVLKEAFSARITGSCDAETGGLVLGMLFGDKRSLGDELYEAFQKNGTAHLLAVSGIHVNVIYLYIRKLLKGRRDLVPSLWVLAFLLTYAALSGFSPSVVRASLMIGFSIGAILAKRGYDMCTGTAAAALVLLCAQPYRLFDLGFQLSFLAVLSLAVLLPWAEMKLKGFADGKRKESLQKALEILGPMAVIQGTMAPITAYCFQYFSWSSFLLNPLLIPLAGIIVPVGLLLFPISFFPGPLGQFLFDAGLNAAVLPAKAMICASQFFSERGIGYFSVTAPPMGLVILFYGCLFFLCAEGCFIARRKGRGRGAAAGIALIFAFSCAFPFAMGRADLPHPFSYKTYPMVFVDVGQGDCLHIRTPDGKNLLVDGGGTVNYNVGKKILAPYLLKNGVKKVDLALVTHLHGDHYRGIQELAAVMPVKRIGIYEGNRVKEEEIRREWQQLGISPSSQPEILYFKKGDRIQLGSGVFVDVLAPEARSDAEYRQLLADETDENAASLVMKVSYRGLTAMMTGDMGFDGEDGLLQVYDKNGGSGGEVLQADILKTGHHGSKYSTSEEFLSAVSPKAAVIQVGKNNFGHPSRRVIELFRNSGIMTYRTDRCGAVLVQKITEDEAVLSDVHKENIWHISLRRRRTMHTRPFKKI